MTSLLSGSEYLEDWLPWELCLDARRDVVLTRTGGLLCAAQVEGPDLETASPEALDALHARLVDAFDGLGTGWSVWLDQWRVPAPGYLPEPPATAPLAARLADASFRRRFTGTGRPVFRNDAFVALHYVPQDRDAFLALLTERGETPVAATVAHFRENDGVGAAAALAHHAPGGAARRRRPRLLPARLGQLPDAPGLDAGRRAGAADGRRRLGHDAGGGDRRAAPRDGGGAQLRLALGHDLRGPARAALPVPLGDDLPRPRPGRPPEGDRRGQEAMGHQAARPGRDPDRDRDQEPVRRADRPGGRPRRGAARPHGRRAGRAAVRARELQRPRLGRDPGARRRPGGAGGRLPEGAGPPGPGRVPEQRAGAPGRHARQRHPGDHARRAPAAARAGDERAPPARRAGGGHPALAGHRRQPGLAARPPLRRPGAAGRDHPPRAWRSTGRSTPRGPTPPTPRWSARPAPASRRSWP